MHENNLDKAISYFVSQIEICANAHFPYINHFLICNTFFYITMEDIYQFYFFLEEDIY